MASFQPDQSTASMATKHTDDLACGGVRQREVKSRLSVAGGAVAWSLGPWQRRGDNVHNPLQADFPGVSLIAKRSRITVSL